MRYALFACCLYLMLISTPAHAKPAPKPKVLIPTIPPITVTYDVYVGGVHLMTADVFFQEQAARYRARVLGHTYGFWYKVLPWNTILKAEGKMRGDRFIPSEFYTRDEWNHKPKSTWLHFKKNGDVTAAFDPPNTDTNREEVTAAQRRGSLDPVTGLLQLLVHVAVHKDCNVSVPIFEGKRRFDIIGSDNDTEAIDDGDYNAFHGTAQVCNAEFTMVAGEWKDKIRDQFWKRDKGENAREPFHINLGAVDPTLPELPVRLESPSVWGLIVMHLSKWHYATPEEMKD